MHNGIKLNLTNCSPDSSAEVLSWIESPEMQFQWTGHVFGFPVSDQEFRSHVSRIASDDSRFAYEVRLEDASPLVAYFELGCIDLDHRSCRLERMIVGPLMNRRKGIGQSVVAHAVDIALRDFGLHRIDLYVFIGNQAAFHCYKKVGFVHEGTMRECRFFDGTFRSMHVMSMLASELSD